MSNILEFPAKEAIYDQASLWIAKLDRNLSAAEQLKLQQWLGEDPKHAEVLFEMAELWDKMDSLARLADLFQAAPIKQHSTPKRTYVALAASFFVAVIALGWSLSDVPMRHQLMAWFEPTSQSTLINGVYETAIGEHSNVNLPDGSVLVLNTNSRISVKYSEDFRLFFLERGEVNIEVAHDTSRPLSVMAGDKLVQAVGTAFNLRMQNNREVELIVTEGKVLVAQHSAQHPSANTPSKRLPSNSMAVSKGEKVMLGDKQEIIAKVAEADIAAELSWRQGNLIFRGETLEQALVEISRYTSVEFEILDDNIRQERIAGLFKAGDVNGLLNALDQNFNIRNERLSNNKIRLSARVTSP